MDLEPTEVEQQDLDAEVLVEVSSDGLRATIQVFPPAGSGHPVDAGMIHSALEAKGVTFGIDETAVQRVVDEQIHYESIVVAEGDPPVMGEDARLVNHYEKDKAVGLQEDSRGKVDFREMNQIINVNQGDLVLEKIPAVEGKPGTTVNNKRIAQKRGKDLRLRIGKNVRVEENGSKFFAEKDGQVTFRNFMLSIEDVFAVEEVGAAVGNIRFKGTVQVTGAVKDNYEIHATESVHITGTAGAARIIAGGNVVIGGGAVGTTIAAGGAVQCKFAEEATITAKGDVLVEEYTKHSRIRSFSAVEVHSGQQEHGSIIGGYTGAQKKIQANNIGSEAEVSTEVRVGVDPEAVDKLMDVRKSVAESIEKFSGFVKNLQLLQKEKEVTPNLPEKKAVLLKRTLQAARSVRDQMGDKIPELISRSRSTVVDEKGRINVLNRTYPNVTICINNQSIVNKTLKTNCSYALLDGDVTTINLRKD